MLADGDDAPGCGSRSRGPAARRRWPRPRRLAPTASRISVAAASTWMRLPGLVGSRPASGGPWRPPPARSRGPAGAARARAAGPRRAWTASGEVLLGRVEPAEQPVEVAAHAGGPARRPTGRRSAGLTAAELVERLRPATVELLELGPAYLALAGEVAHLRLGGDPLRHRGGPLLGAGELVDRPAALDHAAVDDAFHHRRARRRRRAEHGLVETGEALVGVAGRQEEQPLLVQGQRGVLLGAEPPSGPDALLGDPCRALEVARTSPTSKALATFRKTAALESVPSSATSRAARAIQPPPSATSPWTIFWVPSHSARLGRRRARRRGRAGSCRRAPGSRSSPAAAPAGARSPRTGRSPRRRAGLSALRSRRTRRRRAARRARRTRSAPQRAPRDQYRPRRPAR